MITQIITVAIIAIILFFFLIYLFWKIYFLRNPSVIIPEGDSIVSPAFGKIMRIIPFTKKDIILKKGLFGSIHALLSDVATEGVLIVIRLTPFNIHYQRSPVEGIVRKINYSEGKFDNAVLSPFAFENEKNEIISETTDSMQYWHLDNEGEEVIDEGVEGLVGQHPPGQVRYRLHLVVDEQLRRHHYEPFIQNQSNTLYITSIYHIHIKLRSFLLPKHVFNLKKIHRNGRLRR